MSEPIDHHFVPQFYLRYWAADKTSNLVPAWFYTPNGLLKHKALSPKSICFQSRLYELKLDFKDGSGFDSNLETEFYSPHDLVASHAVARCVDTGIVTNSDRGIIAQFIGGLIGRSKFRIEAIQNALRPIFESAIDGLDPDARALVQSKLSDDPTDDMATYASVLMGPEFADRAPDYLVGKTWQILHVDGLLTSDNPVVFENAPKTGFELLFPLSPRHLLIMHDKWLLSPQEYNKRNTRNLANIAILKRAHSRVIGRAERSFIQKHWKP